MGQTKFWTRTITAQLDITKEMNAQLLSVVVLSGTCTITGSAVLNDSSSTHTDSGPVVLTAGMTVIFPADRPNAPLDGITLTPTGNTGVVIRF